jgi:hypothetical protein
LVFLFSLPSPLLFPLRILFHRPTLWFFLLLRFSLWRAPLCLRIWRTRFYAFRLSLFLFLLRLTGTFLLLPRAPSLPPFHTSRFFLLAQIQWLELRWGRSRCAERFVRPSCPMAASATLYGVHGGAVIGATVHLSQGAFPAITRKNVIVDKSMIALLPLTGLCRGIPGRVLRVWVSILLSRFLI